MNEAYMLSIIFIFSLINFIRIFSINLKFDKINKTIDKMRKESRPIIKELVKLEKKFGTMVTRYSMRRHLEQERQERGELEREQKAEEGHWEPQFDKEGNHIGNKWIDRKTKDKDIIKETKERIQKQKDDIKEIRENIKSYHKSLKLRTKISMDALLEKLVLKEIELRVDVGDLMRVD